jgi:hypothetical protein
LYYFSGREKKGRKKGDAFLIAMERRLSRFFVKILPVAQRRCGDFYKNP